MVSTEPIETLVTIFSVWGLEAFISVFFWGKTKKLFYALMVILFLSVGMLLASSLYLHLDWSGITQLTEILAVIFGVLTTFFSFLWFKTKKKAYLYFVSSFLICCVFVVFTYVFMYRNETFEQLFTWYLWPPLPEEIVRQLTQQYLIIGFLDLILGSIGCALVLLGLTTLSMTPPKIRHSAVVGAILAIVSMGTPWYISPLAGTELAEYNYLAPYSFEVIIDPVTALGASIVLAQMLLVCTVTLGLAGAILSRGWMKKGLLAMAIILSFASPLSFLYTVIYIGRLPKLVTFGVIFPFLSSIFFAVALIQSLRKHIPT